MFQHLDEDWPWIVIPILFVTLIAIAVVTLLGPGDESVFTYAL